MTNILMLLTLLATLAQPLRSINLVQFSLEPTNENSRITSVPKEALNSSFHLFIKNDMNISTRAEYIHDVVTMYEKNNERVTPVDTPFTDIDDHPYKSDIEKAYAMGLDSGFTTTKFVPDFMLTEPQKNLIDHKLLRYKENRKKTIQMMFDEDYCFEKEQVEAFMSLPENRGIQFEWDSVPHSVYRSKLLTMFATGNMPDVFFIDNVLLTEITTKEANALYADINTAVTEPFLEDFDESFLRLASTNGKLNFLPVWAEPEGLVYDKDTLQSNNLTVPNTWDEIIRWYKQGNGTNTKEQFLAPIDILAMINILHSYGMTELGQREDGTYFSDIGTEKFKDLLSIFSDVHIQTVDYFVPEFDPSYPMVLATLFNDSLYQDGSNTPKTLSFAPFPVGKQNAAFVFLQGYAVSEGCAEKDVAARLLDALSQKE